jgi:hypothetical protein
MKSLRQPVLLNFALTLMCIVLALSFTACITLDAQDEEKETLKRLAVKMDSAFVGDTVNVIYESPRFESPAAPEVVYTLNFWKADYFDFTVPQIRTAPLERTVIGRTPRWIGKIPVPKNAQVISYYVKNVPNEDSLQTKNIMVFERNGKPVRTTSYRVGQALMRSGYPIDTVLRVLKSETERYETFDAYLLYWTLLYDYKGKTQAARDEIEQDIADVRRKRRSDPDLLQAIGLFYINTFGDRKKAFTLLNDVPDSYLHPFNLYNRYLMEPDFEKRELTLSIMSDRYPASPLLVKMYQAHLFYYNSNQKAYAERGLLFCERIVRRSIPILKSERINTQAIRYLFEFYSRSELSRAEPMVKEVLRNDYDRAVYDPLTILMFSERFADSPDYAGIAIELANKAMQALSDKSRPQVLALADADFAASVPEIEQSDLRGRVSFCLGKAYRQMNDRNAAALNLKQAEQSCASRLAQIYAELAELYKTSDKKEALRYALLAAARQPVTENIDRLRALNPKQKSGETLTGIIDDARDELPELPTASLKTRNGKTVDMKSISGDQYTMIYLWSPRSGLSQALFSDLQLLYAKYHARNLELFAVDADSGAASLNQTGSDLQYDFALAAPQGTMLRSYKLAYLPTLLLIKNNRDVFRYSGFDKNFIAHVETDLLSLFSEGDMLAPKKKKKRR